MRFRCIRRLAILSCYLLATSCGSGTSVPSSCSAALSDAKTQLNSEGMFAVVYSGFFSPDCVSMISEAGGVVEFELSAKAKDPSSGVVSLVSITGSPSGAIDVDELVARAMGPAMTGSRDGDRNADGKPDTPADEVSLGEQEEERDASLSDGFVRLKGSFGETAGAAPWSSALSSVFVTFRLPSGASGTQMPHEVSLTLTVRPL